MIGECYGAAGVMQAVSGYMTFLTNKIPPTVGFKRLTKKLAFPHRIAEKTIKKRINTILINSFDSTGNNASIILQRI